MIVQAIEPKLLLILLHLTHSGYSDRPAPNNGTNSDEEAELQEAIRRSLSDNQTTTPTPSAPPPSHNHDHDHDEDVQRAVEHSLADLQQQHTNTNPPPPYNPAYNPQEIGTSQRTTAVSDIFEAETVIVGDSEQNEGAELRRGGIGISRPSTGGSISAAHHVHREARERQQSRTHTDNMDSVRAARLRRFGGMT